MFGMQRLANTTDAILYLSTICTLGAVVFVYITFADKQGNCDWQEGIITSSCSNLLHD